MRSTIAFLLCISVAQLSWLTTDAFSVLFATRAIAPIKARAAVASAKKVAPAKKATPAKKAPTKKVIKITQKPASEKPNASTKSAAPSKANAITAAKKKANLKAQNKAKAKAALQAKRNTTLKANAKAAAANKKKAIADAKKVASQKAKRVRARAKKSSTSTARNVVNSGTDASLAITKNFKPKKTNNSKPLFPGLSTTKKKPLKKAPTKASVVVAKKKADTLNPIEFGLQVAQSDKGQEAAAILIEGGLKLVEAILAEGKKTKVVIPRGFDKGTGDLKKPKIANIGYKELLDAGIFAGTEFLDVAKSSYDKLYVGSQVQERVRITQTAAKVDKKTGNVLVPVKENYVVKVNGKSVTVSRPLR